MYLICKMASNCFKKIGSYRSHSLNTSQIMSIVGRLQSLIIVAFGNEIRLVA
jgi:hypothetical protein